MPYNLVLPLAKLKGTVFHTSRGPKKSFDCLSRFFPETTYQITLVTLGSFTAFNGSLIIAYRLEWLKAIGRF